jgi:hypothetical protein
VEVIVEVGKETLQRLRIEHLNNEA